VHDIFPCANLIFFLCNYKQEIFNFQGFPARSTVETWTLGRYFLSVYLDVQVSNFNSSQTEFLWPVPKIHLEEGLVGGREKSIEGSMASTRIHPDE